MSILEKAFFKHMTCVQMCEGGDGAEAIFSFLGGIHEESCLNGRTL